MNSTEKHILDDFVITGAAIVDNETFAFIAEANETLEKWKKEDQYPTLIASFHTKTDKWAALRSSNFIHARVAGGKNKRGNKQALFANYKGFVKSFEYKDGPNAAEDTISFDDSTRGWGVDKLKFIGQHFYAAGRSLSLLRRNGSGDWDRLYWKQYDSARERIRCRALDGFSETEIYACAKNAIVLHYDGKTCTHQTLPDYAYDNNFYGSALCCATDGKVYIGGLNGELVVGRHDTGWKMLIGHDPDDSIGEINDLAYFKGKLYAVTDNYLWELEGNKWVGAKFESDLKPVSFAYMDANDDVMLVAGPDAAAVYDGKEWMPLYGGYDNIDLLRLQIMEKQVEDLENIVDTARTVADAIKSE